MNIVRRQRLASPDGRYFPRVGKFVMLHPPTGISISPSNHDQVFGTPETYSFSSAPPHVPNDVSDILRCIHCVDYLPQKASGVMLVIVFVVRHEHSRRSPP